MNTRSNRIWKLVAHELANWRNALSFHFRIGRKRQMRFSSFRLSFGKAFFSLNLAGLTLRVLFIPKETRRVAMFGCIGEYFCGVAAHCFPVPDAEPIWFDSHSLTSHTYCTTSRTLRPSIPRAGQQPTRASSSIGISSHASTSAILHHQQQQQQQRNSPTQVTQHNAREIQSQRESSRCRGVAFAVYRKKSAASSPFLLRRFPSFELAAGVERVARSASRRRTHSLTHSLTPTRSRTPELAQARERT